MGWCCDLVKSDKMKNLAKERHYELLEEVAVMVDRLYELEGSKWETHKEKAETLVMGWHFTQEGAMKAVAAMKNADGTTGQYWSIQDVEEVTKAMSVDWSSKRYNLWDFYYALNMQRSDYYEEGQPPQYYVKRALQFLDDKDAPEGIAKRYWYSVHCLQ